MAEDVRLKARLIRVIGFAETAMAGEGMVVCKVAPAVLAEALDVAERGAPDAPLSWSIVTNRETTRAMLAELECPVRLVAAGERYLAAFADEGGV